MYSAEHVIIHQMSATLCKVKHESNLVKWEKTITAWCAEQHERIRKTYETNHSKLIMSNTWSVNLRLSKFFSDLRVTSLSNRIKCTARNKVLSEVREYSDFKNIIQAFDLWSS